MKTTALIAEDEPLLRAHLKELLALYWPDLSIVAEVDNGVDALAALVSHRPDVAFLDIRMPALSGLEVASAAAGHCHIVFITAFDEYAIRAFDRGAVDYLLKPIDPPRLELALNRLRQRLQSIPADLTGILSQLNEPQKAPRLRWIHAATGLQTRIVSVEQIGAFVAEAKYTRLVGIGTDAHIRKTIKELTQSLDPEQFIQVSRGAIVNLARVERISRDGSGGMKICVDGMDIAVSQAYQHQFRQM
ncbi:LytTR family DNA-binding domain-containing protein [Burkholderiaceae bacterium DAT-1]|nr:LytTR family DNA-binding domain-containing protein [Burkholderiaceae bacterium DAT-1]